MSDRAYVHAHVRGEVAPRLVGQVIVLATGNDGFCRFKYARDWLDAAHAFALDPELLPLAEVEFESRPGWEIFGALRDAGPDYWGRKVIERRTNCFGLSELDFLLAADGERTGALDFTTGRSTPAAKPPVPAARLKKLFDAAARLERDEELSGELMQLLGAGSGSLGGMRPKATVEDGGRLWIAKFPSREDRHAITRWEFATLELAARCGHSVPERRLATIGRRPVLLVARFDRRAGNGTRERAHYLSGLTMLGLHERDNGRGSYADLALWLRRHGSAPTEDVRELFRRMVFNILIANTDDHLRNHAVIDFGDGFRLAPVFDVLPWPATGGERMQAIGVGRDGRLSTLANAASDAGLFGLAQEEAAASIRSLQATVRAEWEPIFRRAGVAKRELSALNELLARASAGE